MGTNGMVATLAAPPLHHAGASLIQPRGTRREPVHSPMKWRWGKEAKGEKPMSFRNMSFAKHGNGSNRGPLRKVIGHRTIERGGITCDRELLECGHLIPCRHDFVGLTNAERRRCGKCKLGHPKDGQEQLS